MERSEQFVFERETVERAVRSHSPAPLQQHGQDVDFEKPANDALELEPYYSGSKRKGLGGKLVSCELIVALDRTGDQSREV